MNALSKLLLVTASVAAIGLPTLSYAQSTLSISFADSTWDGKTVPADQQCSLQGGHGATPPLDISDVPEGTKKIVLSFNDETYQPMNDGGHGTIGFEVTPTDGKVSLPSAPGETETLPAGISIDAPNKTSGDFLRPGYMPPCSGGNGNLYSADVTALDASGATLATGHFELGHY